MAKARPKFGYGGSYAPSPYLGRCIKCRKKLYGTKRDAKLAARRNHPDDRMSVYRCGTGWHYGHLPPDVKAGYRPRPKRES